jgi:TRAP-type C4-dicarboxylate transport system permease small subunit
MMGTIVHRTLDLLAKGFAILGGLIMVMITAITVWSVVGRWLFSKPILGDTEAVEFGMAIAVAAFLPICQWRSANIIVDFFTTRAGAGARRVMDALGALLVAVMLGLIAWRTVLGAIEQKSYFTTTMLLQWPEWIAYAGMVPPLALTVVIALYMVITGRGSAQAASAS